MRKSISRLAASIGLGASLVVGSLAAPNLAHAEGKIRIAEQFGIGVVVSEKVALLADQLDGCLVQGEEVMEVGLLLAHLGIADPPTKRFGVTVGVGLSAHVRSRHRSRKTYTEIASARTTV